MRIFAAEALCLRPAPRPAVIGPQLFASAVVNALAFQQMQSDSERDPAAPNESTADNATSKPEAGWYLATDNDSQEAYWDGTQWTEHRRTAASSPTQTEKPAKPLRLRVVLIALLIAIVTVGGLLFFLNNRAEDEAGKYACEVVSETECIYDERFNEWVPS